MNDLTRKPLLPPQKIDLDEDIVSPAEINRIGKAAGFDLTASKGSLAASRSQTSVEASIAEPIRKSRPPRETRTDVINVRLKPSMGQALRQFTYDEDISMADVIEKMIQQYIIERNPD